MSFIKSLKIWLRNYAKEHTMQKTITIIMKIFSSSTSYPSVLVNNTSARQKSRKCHKSRKTGAFFTTTPLHDKKISSSWPQWSYYWLHLPLRSHNIIISKSCRLAKSAKIRGHFYLDTKNMIPSIEKTFTMTAVIILVIQLIIFIIGSL